MLDKPDAADLLETIAAFLDEEVVAAFEGKRRFHALVTANVARILAREVRAGPTRLENEVRDLWSLLGREGAPPTDGDRASLVRGLSADLCARIDRGDADSGPWRARVLGYLKAAIGRRLEIDNPGLSR